MISITETLKAARVSDFDYKVAALQVESRRWDAYFTQLGHQIYEEKGVDSARIIGLKSFAFLEWAKAGYQPKSLQSFIQESMPTWREAGLQGQTNTLCCAS